MDNMEKDDLAIIIQQIIARCNGAVFELNLIKMNAESDREKYTCERMWHILDEIRTIAKDGYDPRTSNDKIPCKELIDLSNEYENERRNKLSISELIFFNSHDCRRDFRAGFRKAILEIEHQYSMAVLHRYAFPWLHLCNYMDKMLGRKK
jgi:hypothetical protein